LTFLYTKTGKGTAFFLSKRANTMNPKATRKTNFSAINHNKQKMIRKIGHLPPFSKGNTSSPPVGGSALALNGCFYALFY
jgi:hypothetical protein